MKRALQLLNKRGPVKWIGLLLIVIGLLFNFFNTAPGIEDAEGIARVIDGDSLFVGGREVRMHGIDAPEGRQTCQRQGREWACGEEARRVLQRLIGRNSVLCKGLEIDKHQRLLAVCEAAGVDLNREMVAHGFAVAYGRFHDEEKVAKASGKGLWSGEFTRPREWRRERNIGQ
ncbi:MAG: thermonuclease family protein [Alphaproteobacteria bacterium]|nr:thermonuclease family protein [Alphaproteobacteria bacterium]